jgi:glutaconyl-CoA/methylmalonyl-CoA decarboxylase subunit gamma
MKRLRITVNGKTYDVVVQVLEDDEQVASGAGFVSPLPAVTPVQPPQPSPAPAATPAAPAAARRSGARAGDPDTILAPIAGVVQKVFVDAGARVDAKSPLILLDAMKMDTYIYAPRDGQVAEVSVSPGDAVQVGERLIRYEPER